MSGLDLLLQAAALVQERAERDRNASTHETATLLAGPNLPVPPTATATRLATHPAAPAASPATPAPLATPTPPATLATPAPAPTAPTPAAPTPAIPAPAYHLRSRDATGKRKRDEESDDDDDETEDDYEPAAKKPRAAKSIKVQTSKRSKKAPGSKRNSKRAAKPQEPKAATAETAAAPPEDPTPSGRFFCDACPHLVNGFGRRAEANRHFRTVHNQRSLFWCPIEGCNGTWSRLQWGNQYNHVRRKHGYTNLRDMCKECGALHFGEDEEWNHECIPPTPAVDCPRAGVKLKARVDIPQEDTPAANETAPAPSTSTKGTTQGVTKTVKKGRGKRKGTKKAPPKPKAKVETVPVSGEPSRASTSTERDVDSGYNSGSEEPARGPTLDNYPPPLPADRSYAFQPPRAEPHSYNFRLTPANWAPEDRDYSSRPSRRGEGEENREEEYNAATSMQAGSSSSRWSAEAPSYYPTSYAPPSSGYAYPYTHHGYASNTYTSGLRPAETPYMHTSPGPSSGAPSGSEFPSSYPRETLDYDHPYSYDREAYYPSYGARPREDAEDDGPAKHDDRY